MLKRKFISRILLFLLALSSIAFSQNLRRLSSNQTPEAEMFCQLNLSGLKQIADLSLNDFYNPLLYFFAIHSNSSFFASLRITITITDCADPELQDREVILETEDFQIKPQQVTYSFLPEQIVRIKIDDDLREAIISNGGLLLAGKYCFQFQVFDKNSGQLAGVSNVDCLEIFAPQPPELIYPENNAKIQNRQINFQWLSVGARPGMNIRYRLTIAEKKTGQAAQEAILQIPFFLSDESSPIEKISSGNREIINFIYPYELKIAEPFANGKSYVWQVQAFDKSGRPVGSNEGKSQIFEFTLISPNEAGERVEIIFEFKRKKGKKK